MESKQERVSDTTFEPKIEPTLEPNPEPKEEITSEPKQELVSEPRLEQRAEPSVDARAGEVQNERAKEHLSEPINDASAEDGVPDAVAEMSPEPSLETRPEPAPVDQKPPGCTKDSNCSSGFVCLKKKCVVDVEYRSCNTGCTKLGYVCVDINIISGIADLRCLRPCASNSDCQSNYDCAKQVGSSYPKGCFVKCSGGCGPKHPNLICSTTYRRCVSRHCRKGVHSDCGTGGACVNISGRTGSGAATKYYCHLRCRSSADCPSAFSCRYSGGFSTGSGAAGCYRRCTKDSDCTKYDARYRCSPSRKVCLQWTF